MIFLLYIGTLHRSLCVPILLSCQGWIKGCLLARTVADRNSTMTDSFIHFLIWHTEIWVADSDGTSGMSLLTIEQNLDKISLYLFHVQLNQEICNAKKSRKSNRQYLKTSRQFWVRLIQHSLKFIEIHARQSWFFVSLFTPIWVVKQFNLFHKPWGAVNISQ